MEANTDDRWACSACGSENIDGFQGAWFCLDCGAVWSDPPEEADDFTDDAAEETVFP